MDKTGNRSEPSDELGPAHHMLAPAKPTGLATTTGNAIVRLTWSANTEADLHGYYVYYGTNGFEGQYDFRSTLIGPTAPRSLDLDGLTNGRVYFIWVRAVDTGKKAAC